MKKLLTILAVLVFASSASADVGFDMSSAYNYDAVGTQAEVDAAASWFNDYNPTSVYALDASFDNTVVGEYYRGTNHAFANAYNSLAVYSDPAKADSLQAGATITTANATYTLASAYDTGSFDPSLARMPVQYNVLRLGTSRGCYTDSTNETTAAKAIAQTTVMFGAGQQGQYSSINALMTGTQYGQDKDLYGVTYSGKFAWVNIYAVYAGEEATPDLVWTSPKVDTFEGDLADPTPHAPYGDSRDDIAGGIPGILGNLDVDNMEAAYLAEFTATEVSTWYLARGGSPAYSYGRDDATSNNPTLYDVNGGIAVDPTKTLVGVMIEVDNGANTWLSGYTEGDTVNVWAVSGTPVPEPATMGLLSLGLLGLVARRRK